MSTRNASLADEGLLLASEVAKLLHCSQRWVYDAAQRGELACIRLGNMVRFERQVVAALIERSRTQAQPPSLKNP